MSAHSPTDIAAELLIDGTWESAVSGVDIASRVRGGNGEGSISITRGVADQQSGISAQSSVFTLENNDGFFNDDNPASPLYHLIPLNTRIRFGVQTGGSWDAYLRIPEYPTGSEPAQYAYTADKASLDITGDIDIRAEFSPQRARGRELILATKYLASGTDRSWLLHTTPGGGFKFYHSTDGTFAGVLSNTTTATIAENTVRSAVRLTLDVNNGAAGRTYTWYTATSIDGPWTVLETNVVAGTTSIHAGGANLGIGASSDGGRGVSSSDVFAGKIHGVEVYDGIAGTLVADFKPADQPTMETIVWDDGCASPNTWHINGSDVRLGSDRVRFTGMLGAIPLDWDSTGNNVFSTVTASGLLAQLNNTGRPLMSCVRQHYRLNTDITDYWPCEDENGATQAASALATGGKAAQIFDCSFGAQADFPGSAGMLTFNTASSSFARFAVGTFPSATGATTVIFYFNTSGLPASDVVFATAYVHAGTVRMWRFSIGATTFTHTLVDVTGATVATANSTFGAGANPNGQTVAMCLQLSQEGGNVRWQNVWHAVGSSTFYTTTGGGATFAGTCGQFVQVNYSVPNANLAGARVGHVIITHALTAINSITFADVSKAFDGETFGERAQRLCAQEGVVFQWRGDITATQQLGPQAIAKLYDILTAGQKVAGGIITDIRDDLGIELITQQYLGNRRGLELSYSDSHLTDVGRPVNDLRYLVNDFTASREGGSSARHEVTEGRKSVNDPPDGSGRWVRSDSYAAYADSQAILLAGRETFTGTWPERRIPSLTVGLHRTEISGTAALQGTLMRDVIALELGDPVNLTGLSTSPLPPDDLLMVALGYTETISNKLWSTALNTVPAGPFQVPVLGDYSGREPRMDADDDTHSLLKSSVTTTATSFVVKTDAASTRRVTKWVDSTNFPDEVGAAAVGDDPVINIGGEWMTVTDIGTASASGGFNEQTFTVTRSTNGVVKEHDALSPVRLAQPFYLGME